MFTPYRFIVLADTLNVRACPSKKAKRTTKLRYGDSGIIVEEQDSWGKLLSGSGWICLKYIEKVEAR